MTPSNSLLLFSLGPVQDFIAASRKTKDLFGGSLLLSYLSGIAIETVSKYNMNGKPLGVESIIFPSLNDDKINLLDTAFPNRFLAIVPSEHVIGIASAAEKSVRDKLQEIANGVISLESVHSLLNEMKSAGVDQYKSQVENFVECYWAAVEWNGVPADYGSTYERVEGALGQRKLIRNFKQIAEQGEKCSLIPSLVDVVNAKSSGGKERLSGVAIVKRFFPSWRKTESKFPSTSTVAVSDFVKDILSLSKRDETIRNLARIFAEKVNAVRSQFASQPLPMTKTLADQNNLSEFATIDGDWFFEDQYESENLRKALEEEKSKWIYPRELATAAKSALRALLKRAKELDVDSPSKYYAVIRFDGDRMGKWLSGAFGNPVSIKEHRQLSAKLLEFNGRLKEIVERRHCGQIVYAGGDDVLAFLTLRDCLDVSKDIREA
ncbi:MAG: type III-B CRISPR-associated protein Cas10/Cmr2, partial [Thaumarchaeota archaeon]|nr:type III-B CRISPR-associated protein Cas10/Cmr2 [Nitrososphaerota archaeon]